VPGREVVAEACSHYPRWNDHKKGQLGDQDGDSIPRIGGYGSADSTASPRDVGRQRQHICQQNREFPRRIGDAIVEGRGADRQQPCSQGENAAQYAENE